jgi:hypothetical protein
MFDFYTMESDFATTSHRCCYRGQSAVLPLEDNDATMDMVFDASDNAARRFSGDGRGSRRSNAKMKGVG